MKPILIRLENELVSRIDTARGDVPRTVFLRRMIDRNLQPLTLALGAFAAAATPGISDSLDNGQKARDRALGEPVTRTVVEDTHFSPPVSFGPVARKPGSLLKAKK